jgi:hypothetical protein
MGEVSMNMRKIVLGAVAALIVGPVLGAEVDGKWNASVDTPQGPFTMVFELKADGEKLTGAMSNEFMPATAISDGVIKGADVSFKLAIQTPDGSSITILYRGKLQGDELNMLTTFAGTPPPGAPEGEQPLVLKRAK